MSDYVKDGTCGSCANYEYAGSNSQGYDTAFQNRPHATHSPCADRADIFCRNLIIERYRRVVEDVSMDIPNRDGIRRAWSGLR